MNKPSFRESMVILGIIAYGGTVLFLCTLRPSRAITGLLLLGSLTTMALIASYSRNSK